MSENPRVAGNDSWKLWLAAGVGAAVLAIGGLWFFKKSEPKKDKEKTKKKKAKAKAKAAAASAASESKTESTGKSETSSKSEEKPKARSSASSASLPNDNELVQALTQSIGELQQHGDVTGPLEQKLLGWMHNMAGNYDKFTTRSRLLAAQWMIVYYTLKSMSATTAEEFKAAVSAQNDDMLIAWELLDCTSSTDEESQALDLLRLDVCQRLKDHRKMSPVFDRVLARGSDMNYEDVMVAFTTAPLLGRWSAVRQLGAKIIEQQGSLEDFHKAALQRPDIPDFEVLYNLAEEEEKKGDTAQDQFSWSSYLIKSMRIRLRDVHCEDESKVDKVRSAFDPDGQGSWKSIPVNGESTKLVRFGAIAQMLSLSTVPIPMVGPATNDHIKVLGYLVLSPPNGIRMKQTESYSMRRGEGDVWNGEYTLIQERATSGSSTPTVKLVFDMEMSLQPLDS